MIITTIIILLIILLIILIIIEVANFIVFGKFVSKNIKDVYMVIDESKLRINMFNSTILMIEGNHSISKLPFSIFSKYYISNIGTIPRFSKLHKKVNEYFDIALKKEQGNIL